MLRFYIFAYFAFWCQILELTCQTLVCCVVWCRLFHYRLDLSDDRCLPVLLSHVRCPIPTWPVRRQTLTYFAPIPGSTAKLPRWPFVQNNPKAILRERKQICKFHENICILWKTCFGKRQNWKNLSKHLSANTSHYNISRYKEFGKASCKNRI